MKEHFLNLPNRSQVVTDLPLQLLTSNNSSYFDACDDGHTSEVLLKKQVLWFTMNVLLKSFSFCVNGKIVDAADKSKKRKLEMLKKCTYAIPKT